MLKVLHDYKLNFPLTWTNQEKLQWLLLNSLANFSLLFSVLFNYSTACHCSVSVRIWASSFLFMEAFFFRLNSAPIHCPIYLKWSRLVLCNLSCSQCFHYIIFFCPKDSHFKNTYFETALGTGNQLKMRHFPPKSTQKIKTGPLRIYSGQGSPAIKLDSSTLFFYVKAWDSWEENSFFDESQLLWTVSPEAYSSAKLFMLSFW